MDARNEEAQPTVGIMRHVCASETGGDQTGGFQMLDCAWRGLAVADPGEKGVQREEENGLENSIEQRPGNDQTKQGEIPGMLHPIKVTLGGALGHQDHDSRVSIERRHGQQVERTQEFTLRWFTAAGASGEIVRQQWNFSPTGSTREIEEYTVSVDGVSVLELALQPNISDHHANESYATLAAWRVGTAS